jgi:hypothetical protein
MPSENASGSVLLVSVAIGMIKRGGWGHLYCIVSGEMLGLVQDKLLRKRLLASCQGNLTRNCSLTSKTPRGKAYTSV